MPADLPCAATHCSTSCDVAGSASHVDMTPQALSTPDAHLQVLSGVESVDAFMLACIAQPAPSHLDSVCGRASIPGRQEHQL